MTEVVKVRVSRDDLATLRAKSDGAGLPLSGFLRAAGLGRKLNAVPDDVRHGLVNLGRLGGILRLALAQIDQGRLNPALRAEIQQTLEDVRSLAACIRDLLR